MLTLISPMAIFWLILMIALLVVEAMTVGLVSIWFGGGALIALISAGLGAPIWLQVALFLVVSALLLALLRPIARNIASTKKTATNADRNIGREAVVVEEIDRLNNTGAVRIDGIIWTARAENDEKIPAGTIIRVNRIEGAKVWVSPLKDNLPV